MSEPTVSSARTGALQRITLNRPKAINALTLTMIREIDAALDAAESDDAVRCVVLDGAGDRGFCAGGDIVTLREAALSGEHEPAVTFWREEYALDLRIAEFKKPIVAIMDGIVMGGGIGLAGHAAHRVATERLVSAMPEVGIGYFPDVGGTWLLSRSPGELGTHLALTGARIGARDAVTAGLADTIVAADAIPALITALEGGDVGVIADAAAPVELPDGTLAEDREWIDPAYAGDDPAAILARLEARPEEGAAAAAKAIRKASPTSVAVTLRALRLAAKQPDLGAVLRQDLATSTAFLDTLDFPEGIRAAVVDKDRNPRWSPGDLAAVSDIDRFF